MQKLRIIWYSSLLRLKTATLSIVSRPRISVAPPINLYYGSAAYYNNALGASALRFCFLYLLRKKHEENIKNL